MTKLIKLNDKTYINPQYILMVAFNQQTLSTAVFLTNGLAVESTMPFDETAKAIKESL